MHSLTDLWSEQETFDWRGWLLPVALAFVTHIFLLWLVIGQSEGPSFPVARSIHVTLVNLASPRKEVPAKVEEVVKPVDKPEPVVQPVEQEPKPVRRAVKQAVAAPPEPLPAPVSVEPVEAAETTTQPAIPDSRPDYHAAYLHNPPPLYPNAARRRGFEGRVLLHVEVMAAGRCGHIEVQQSSGHDILDTAAVEAVKEWRFIPATHFGFPVTRWMHIPIRFELTERD